MRLTILGGGSVWTPELVRLLSGLPQAEDLRVSLYGPTPSHLEGVAALARTLAGGRPAVRVIRELGPALDGADVVLNQARIGGLHARRDDEALPVRLGAIGDESLGLGGLRAATRAVPFVHGAARELLRFSPTAWVLNLANPSDLLSRVWSEAGCSNVISLCDHADNYAAQIHGHGPPRVAGATPRPRSARASSRAAASGALVERVGRYPDRVAHPPL